MMIEMSELAKKLYQAGYQWDAQAVLDECVEAIYREAEDGGIASETIPDEDRQELETAFICGLVSGWYPRSEVLKMEQKKYQ